MCEFLSAWINAETHEIACADPRSHSGTQEILGWDSAEVQKWREWEWVEPGDEDDLVVRTPPDDVHEPNWYRAIILARWPKWSDAINGCMALIPTVVKRLYLGGATIPSDLRIPDSVTTLYMRYTTIPSDLRIPDSVTTLDMRYATIPSDLRIPDSVTELYMSGATIPSDLRIPDSVTTLYMRYTTIPSDLRIPNSVTECYGYTPEKKANG